MEILYLLIGIVIGIIIGRFLGILKNKENTEEITRNLHSEKANRIKAEVELKTIKSSYQEAQNQIKTTFEALAAKAINDNNHNFIHLASQTFEKYVSQADGNFKTQNKSFHSLWFSR